MARKISSSRVVSVLSALGMGFFVNVRAQGDFSSFRDSLLNGYGEFREKTLTDYDNYRNQINSEFIGFLSSAWSDFQQNEGAELPTRKLPTIPPVIYHEERETKPAPVIEIKPEDLPRPKPQPSPEVPVEENVAPRSKIGIRMYGTALEFAQPDLSGTSCQSTRNEDIMNFWGKLADGRMDCILQECLSTRLNRSLNDWAYLNMLCLIGERLFPQNEPAQTLATAYLYTNSGYKMRIGRTNGRLGLLFASEHDIYNWPYFIMDGEKYYPLNNSNDRMEICAASFHGEEPLSLLYAAEPKLDKKESPLRELRSTMGVKARSKVNENLMDFYSSYPVSALHDDPLSRWVMTCNSPMCAVARQTLYPTLKEAVKGKGTYEQVNILLNFVQTAFVYEYDDKVWGGDRAFYPDEVLYYPYCDCEDRTSLFTRLVRDLIGLECAIVYYPGHLAAAVKFPQYEHVGGDKLKLDGGEFTICDPTYINASVGMSMPGLDITQIRAMILK